MSHVVTSFLASDWKNKVELNLELYARLRQIEILTMPQHFF